ncbi:hypothetical protein RYA99_03210 [Pseudomonas syringae pv. actinidifoliorum]|nr:hypothetical protein [Pseudomonas syringae pv. actinidifoliorum]MDU8523578.1 hypothetical protein [Pseudomonas syringae pv. actinidifoliorum]MDU8525188.1 hypothetical protein [Pseudomonas syringae pv. actinidifoliorum]
MQVLFVPMRHEGVALEPKASERYRPIKGNVVVRSTHSEYLGRCAKVASLDVGMPKETKPLPELLDVPLATMAHNGFVLSGIEYINECAYAQS